MSEIKIVLVDDHALIRAGYKSILDDIEDITLIGEAANGEAAIQIVGELKPDVLVLDITMPGKSGLEVAKELRANGSDVKILMLSYLKFWGLQLVLRQRVEENVKLTEQCLRGVHVNWVAGS